MPCDHDDEPDRNADLRSVNVNQENPILRENSGGSFGSGGVQGLWVVVTILVAYALGIRSWFHVRFGGRS